MAFSPQRGDAELPLSVFGGLVTNQPAGTLPEGVSPDNQDMAYLPGNVFSRPALQKVFNVAFPAGGPNNYVPTITYSKTFVTPTGDVEQLYLDSNGLLWWEDVSNTPGTITNIGVTAPGTWGKSITAFGREYIALTDGLHGADVALQWDGTNLDRVTQEGPGAPPQVASIALPSVAMANLAAPATLTITSCNVAGNGFNVICTTSTSALFSGQQVTISASSVGFFNATWTIVSVYPSSDMFTVVAYVPPGTSNGAGGTVTPNSGNALVRAGNTVTAYTASAHQLQVGYQAQIAGVPAATIGTSISKIVINNENLPGLATVTTSTAHGLVPEVFVSITGVTAVAVGTAITAISCVGGIVNVTTSAAHGLSPGAVVTISGTTNYNGTVVVSQIVSTTQFTYLWTLTTAPGSEAAGTVSLTWPIPDTATPSYFEVVACPTSTTFQIAINYSDSPAGGWTSGTVKYEWNGTFYVTAVLNSTSFQYQQYGPNAVYTESGGETVTPWGQLAPGKHQCQVSFILRSGYITRPSPPVVFEAAGGQYLSVSNIPVGPANVVGRILLFTSADGAYFFYIPVPAMLNGQQVSTATQINDNTSTTAFLDFSDTTLLSAQGASIPGNNLAAQVPIEGALGFGYYGSRLMTWGQRNRITNLLGMGFESGYIPNGGLFTIQVPLGWTIGTSDVGTASSGLVAGSLLTRPRTHGFAFQVHITSNGTPFGKLTQSMYLDGYGAPIATPNATYRFRCLYQSAAPSANFTFFVSITSASASFSSTCSFAGNLSSVNGNYVEAAFSTAMPNVIPADLILTIYGQSSSGIQTFTVDEMSILYAQDPYKDATFYVSYVENPEAFDGTTGVLGSNQDNHKVMEVSEIRKTGYFLTQEPGGRLHQFTDNGVTEPSGWTVDQVATNCGLVSAWGLTKSQADDSSSAGGEEWFAWISAVGARIFGGDQPWEISREIQPDWAKIGPANGVAPAYAQFCWALNDPTSRTMYFGLCQTGVSQGAPNIVYALNYVGLDSAYAIGTTGPVRVSYTGKLIATDHSRKWTRWNMTMNGGALATRYPGSFQPVFFGGNGQTPGNATSHGNTYILNPGVLTDDDYGQISPYYVTYFMMAHDQEQAFQMAGYRKLLAYVTGYVSGTGILTVTPFSDKLGNVNGIAVTRTLQSSPANDLSFAGCAAQGDRIALKFASSPATGTDNAFSLSRLTCWMRKVARLPVRGAA